MGDLGDYGRFSKNGYQNYGRFQIFIAKSSCIRHESPIIMHKHYDGRFHFFIWDHFSNWKMALLIGKTFRNRSKSGLFRRLIKNLKSTQNEQFTNLPANAHAFINEIPNCVVFCMRIWRGSRWLTGILGDFWEILGDFWEILEDSW